MSGTRQFGSRQQLAESWDWLSNVSLENTGHTNTSCSVNLALKTIDRTTAPLCHNDF